MTAITAIEVLAYAARHGFVAESYTSAINEYDATVIVTSEGEGRIVDNDDLRAALEPTICNDPRPLHKGDRVRNIETGELGTVWGVDAYMGDGEFSSAVHPDKSKPCLYYTLNSLQEVWERVIQPAPVTTYHAKLTELRSSTTPPRWGVTVVSNEPRGYTGTFERHTVHSVATGEADKLYSIDGLAAPYTYDKRPPRWSESAMANAQRVADRLNGLGKPLTVEQIRELRLAYSNSLVTITKS